VLRALFQKAPLRRRDRARGRRLSRAHGATIAALRFSPACRHVLSCRRPHRESGAGGAARAYMGPFTICDSVTTPVPQSATEVPLCKCAVLPLTVQHFPEQQVADTQNVPVFGNPEHVAYAVCPLFRVPLLQEPRSS